MNQNLTKREYVAAMMLQAVMCGKDTYTDEIDSAIEIADKLLAKLAETEPQAEIEPEAPKQYPTLPEGVTVPEGYELLAYGETIPKNALLYYHADKTWEATLFGGRLYEIRGVILDIYCIPKP
jgi:hypothetical protein